MSVPTIAAARLGELAREGKPLLLIDVRTPAEFREVHVEFARNIPLDQVNQASLQTLVPDAHGSPIYFVCAHGNRSRMACEQLLKAGVLNVIDVEGGTTACVNAGLPVMRGKKTMSLDNQVRVVSGSIVLIGVVLGWFVHPYFYGLAAFIGAGNVYAGLSNTCGMGMLLSKMPWNKAEC